MNDEKLLKSEISINILEQINLNYKLLNEVNSKSEYIFIENQINCLTDELSCRKCYTYCNITENSKICVNKKCKYIEVIR